MSNPKLYRERELAARIQERYNEDVARVRENPDLSDEGRQRQLADLYAGAKVKVAKHITAEREMVARRRTELERELFGARKSPMQDAGSFAISARDASDRAAQIKTADEALDLLRRAETNGDDVLARAVARVSAERMYSGIRLEDAKWEGILNDYVGSRPHLQATVEELGEIEDMSAPAVFSPFSIFKPPGVADNFLNTATRRPTDRQPEVSA